MGSGCECVLWGHEGVKSLTLKSAPCCAMICMFTSDMVKSTWLMAHYYRLRCMARQVCADDSGAT
jgi:hypothetical protein